MGSGYYLILSIFTAYEKVLNILPSSKFGGLASAIWKIFTLNHLGGGATPTFKKILYQYTVRYLNLVLSYGTLQVSLFYSIDISIYTQVIACTEKSYKDTYMKTYKHTSEANKNVIKRRKGFIIFFNFLIFIEFDFFFNFI